MEARAAADCTNSARSSPDEQTSEAVELLLDDNMWSFDGVRSHIERSRVAGAQGTVIFASAYLEPDRWSAFVGDGPFAEPAPVPAMSWK
jgi:hypothetical protein